MRKNGERTAKTSSFCHKEGEEKSRETRDVHCQNIPQERKAEKQEPKQDQERTICAPSYPLLGSCTVHTAHAPKVAQPVPKKRSKIPSFEFPLVPVKQWDGFPGQAVDPPLLVLKLAPQKLRQKKLCTSSSSLQEEMQCTNNIILQVDAADGAAGGKFGCVPQSLSLSSFLKFSQEQTLKSPTHFCCCCCCNFLLLSSFHKSVAGVCPNLLHFSLIVRMGFRKVFSFLLPTFFFLYPLRFFISLTSRVLIPPFSPSMCSQAVPRMLLNRVKFITVIHYVNLLVVFNVYSNIFKTV